MVSNTKSVLAGIQEKTLRFKVWPTKGALPQEYYFIINKNRELVKWGDGTFGVVYEVRQSKGDSTPYVVKLLYASKAGKNSKLSRSDLENIKLEFDREFSDITKERKQFVEKLIREASGYLEKVDMLLQSNTLTQTQTNFLYKAINRAAASSDRDRFNEEILVTNKLTAALDDYPGLVTDNVVRVIGGTEEFLISEAGQKLQEYFSSKGYQISNYALVMERYEYTLKSLLERKLDNQFHVLLSKETEQEIQKLGVAPRTLKRVHKGKNPEEVQQQFEVDLKDQLTQKRKSKKHLATNETETLLDNDIVKKELERSLAKIKVEVRQLVGYDLLRSLDFSTRLKTIRPIIIQVAKGINALHKAGLYHRDLKPANIYLKDDDDKVIKLVVGDLGFLDVSDSTDSGNTQVVGTMFLETIPRGTRHYRSPEQKDYFDLCDAKVATHRELDLITLTVTDPKFRDTIVQEGDLAVFSKDEDSRFPVMKIKGQDDRSDNITVTLAGKGIDDELTQVVFFKQQKTKTDIFGLGAIAYDLITCGDSPERFYDKIRNLDTWDNSVEKIIDEYDKLSNFQSPEQAYLSIFEAFQYPDTSTYAPPEIVNFILSCMLYRAEGTYCGPFGEFDNKAIDRAIKDLEENFSDYQTDAFAKNPLLIGEIKDDEDQTNAKLLLQIVEELQDMPANELAKRVLDADKYLRELHDLVEVSCDQNSKKYLIQLRPDKIRHMIDSNGNGRLETLQATAYPSREEYEQDLADDSVYFKITRSLSNPFIPDYLSFMRREVTLNKPQKTSPQTTNWHYSIKFPDSSWLGDKIQIGDWLIINNIAYRIQDRNGLQVVLDKEPVLDSEKLTGVIYYQDFNQLEYYFQVLGIFLYQLFFAGIGLCTRNKPSIIHVAQSMNLMNKNSINLYERDLNQLQINPIQRIYLELSRIYLRLILTGCKFSYLQSDNDFSEKPELDAFYDDIEDRLKPALEAWLGRNSIRHHRTTKSSLSTLPLSQEERNQIRQESNTFAESMDIEKYLLFWLNFRIKESPSIEDLNIPISKTEIEEEDIKTSHFYLTIKIRGHGEVNVEPRKKGYVLGEKVALTPNGKEVSSNSNKKSRFVGWSSDNYDLGKDYYNSPLIVEMNGDATLTATFE